MTTAEHLRASSWWPTRGLSPEAGYVGTAACAKCHADVVESQRTSQMARTLVPAGESKALRAHLGKGYRSGPYLYALHESGRDVLMTVRQGGDKGAESRSAVLRWAFGSGDVGQSYLWAKDGRLEESRFNYFATLDGFGATPGRLHGEPVSLEMAVGRVLEPFEAKTCFGCHTTAMTAETAHDGSGVVPGVSCEACHGPGAEHVAAAEKAAVAEKGKETSWDKRVMNPADLSPAAAVDFCGGCHSTPADVRVMGAVGLQTVRFPAYRLEQSRCWGAAGDRRLTCFTCHDPHAPLEREAAAYDGACLECHVGKGQAVAAAEGHPGKACPVGTAKCVSCHMPKFELPEMHYKFTDHRIRVARADAAFPD